MRIFKNVLTLYGLQFSLYLIPFLTTPYLSRTLGVEAFGIIGVSTGLIGYLQLVTDWGFNLTAVQAVARNAHDPIALRRIFWDVLTARGLLMLTCFGLLALALAVSKDLRAMKDVLLASSPALIASGLGVGWFLQGLERMGRFAIASLVGRFASLPLTFLLIHSPKDAALAVLIQSGTLLISTAASWIGAAKAAELLPMRFDLKGAGDQIRDGWQLFLSTGAVSLYTTSNIVILGFLAGPIQAGLLNGAERIRRAVQGLTGPISNAMFPRINNMMVHERHKVWTTMKLVILAQGSFTALLSLALFVTGPWLAVNFLGRQFAGSGAVLQALAPTLFLVGLNNVLGTNMMLPMGMKTAFTSILIVSGAVNISLFFVLIPPFGAVGAAASVSVTELIVTAAMAAWLAIKRVHHITGVMAPAPSGLPGPEELL